MKIPLFPLPSVVLPGGQLPLRLFEPRYLRMVSDCLKQESGFGICLARPKTDDGEPLKPYPLGTVAKIVDFDQGNDGFLHITVQGEQEFRLIDMQMEPDKLQIGEIELQPQGASFELPSQYSSLSVKLSQILDHLGPHMEFPNRNLDDADWVCNRLLELLPIDAADKYEMLNSFDTLARLKALDDLSFSIAAQ